MCVYVCVLCIMSHRGTVDEAREIVTRARMWRWKPDGEVTYRFAQDANGAPLPLMQVRTGLPAVLEAWSLSGNYITLHT